MAHGIKNMSRQKRCPICGKPDYCGWFPAQDGGLLLFCQRYTEEMQNGEGVIGLDGNYYIKVGKTRSGNSMFEEANQRLAKQRLKEGIDIGNLKTVNIQPRALTPVNIVEPLSNKRLHEMYRFLLDHLYLDDKDREYLHREGWSDELIDRYNIKTFPVTDFERFQNREAGAASKNPWRKTLGKMLEKEFGSLAGMPGAYRNTKGEWTLYGEDGILFPQLDQDGNYYRLRIRLHHTGEKGGKYRNFSSFIVNKEEEQKGFLVNKLDGGSQAGNQLGYYMNKSRDDMYAWYITEGEKKGIYGEDCLKSPFVSLPGVSSWSKLFDGKAGERAVDFFRTMGVKIVIVVFDADKICNPMVYKKQEELVEKLQEENFLVGIGNWDPSLGKGIDDLLRAGHKPTYQLRK